MSKAEAKRSARKLGLPSYKSFRLQPRIEKPKTRLTGAFRLFVNSTTLLLKNKRFFGSLILISLLCNLVFVRGFSSATNITDLKGAIDGVFTGATGQLASGATIFAVLVSGSGSSSTETGAVYQSILIIVFSLAYIWTLRQLLTPKPKKHALSSPFYRGMTPLIPFIGVFVVIGIQLLPLVSANFLYTTVINGGLATTPPEQVLWYLLIALLATLSLYMVSSSIFALYIVTLGDVKPLEALRSARELVRFRRWSIIRKLMVLPVVLAVIGAVIVIPIIIFAPAAAEWAYYVLTMMALPITHSYLYHLYRELL